MFALWCLTTKLMENIKDIGFILILFFERWVMAIHTGWFVMNEECYNIYFLLWHTDIVLHALSGPMTSPISFLLQQVPNLISPVKSCALIINCCIVHWLWSLSPCCLYILSFLSSPKMYPSLCMKQDFPNFYPRLSATPLLRSLDLSDLHVFPPPFKLFDTF